MSFLAPFFLIGGLAIAGPVIFHLIRQTTRERKLFSSLMFLEPSPPRLTRRSRLEHLFLLFLRCAALVLLAFGFARPFLKHAVANPNAAAGRRVVLLVDTSASMRRQGLWPDAQNRVAKFLEDVSPLDQVALMAFDRTPRMLLSFDQWSSAQTGERVASALGRLKAEAPGWGGTHLGRALIAAAETLADEPGKPHAGPRQIVLFTDFQEGSRLESLQGYEWPKETQLIVETVASSKKSNAGLLLVTDSAAVDGPESSVTRVRINNSAGAAREQFKVGWSGGAAGEFVTKPIEVYVPAGQSRVVSMPIPTNQNPTRITLQGDDEDFDNTIFVVAPETKRSKVLYFGSEIETDASQPLYFLRRAFQETRRQAVQVIARSNKSPATAIDFSDAALVVVTENPGPEASRELRAQLLKGGTALFIMRNEGAAASIATVLDVDKPELIEQRPKNYAMFGEIDFTHPLFAAFSDPRFNDFTKIHFWKYWRMDVKAIPGARVLARFDNHDPAILEAPVGKGRVMAMFAGWQPEESQLALSTKFVPLLYALLDLGSPAPEAAPQYFVGDSLPLVDSTGAANRTVRLPDGLEQKFAGTNFSETTMPGIYEIRSGVEGKATRFAVNLEASESRTDPMPTDQLESMGAPMQTKPTAAAIANAKVRLQNGELESRQKLWRWFLLATLLIVIFETWMAGRTARVTPAPV